MNPVLILTRNCLELTKRCVESVHKQDIPTGILAIDNGSTDGTLAWLESDEYGLNIYQSHPNNTGVSAAWNEGLNYFWGPHKAGQHRGWRFPEHVLVCGNDTVLAPWTYSALLSANVPFVTGVDVGMSPLPEKPDVFPLSPHPDFSCFLIRRECWEKVGPFDERMFSWASDCAYHVEAHRKGVPLYKASVPYNHERSSTMNRATPQERQFLNWQANQDRMVFKSLYNCLPGQPEYAELFK